MKLAPVSADLLIKIGLGLAAIGAVVWASRQVAGSASGAISRAWDTATAAGWALSPTNNNNVIAATANNAVSAITGREETLGGWLYTATHPDPVTSWTPPAAPVQTFQDQGVQPP